jgi:hypothetical protein
MLYIPTTALLMRLFITAVLCVCSIVVPLRVKAQQSLALSVTPPFSQMVVEPGDVFKSYVKIINTNIFPLTVYATPVNFASADENGTPSFIPLVGETPEKSTLASWITVAKEPLEVLPESSAQLEYTITVPENAPPGGHFAAILIGTKPPEGSKNDSVKTSQVVSSLFMVRVTGDVKEEGQIREFSIDDALVSSPEATFSLRFLNAGNVYLQPQGDITIYNMWGKERGVIPVNQKTNFGNVLPQSIRKFSFTWSGTPSISDIGRHKAIATISYGIDEKRSVDRTIYFWVVPIRGTLLTIGFILFFGLLVVFSIRRYIQRVLNMAGIEKQVLTQHRGLREKVTRREIVAPLRAGVLDLRSAVQGERNSRLQKKNEHPLRAFVHLYRIPLLLIGAVLLFALIATWFVMEAREDARPYEVRILRDDGSAPLNTTGTTTPKEVLAQPLSATPVSPARANITVVNASGKDGAVDLVRTRIINAGFSIQDVSRDADVRPRSVIIYNQSMATMATKLSGALDNIPLSVRPAGEEAEPSMLLIIGAE